MPWRLHTQAIWHMFLASHSEFLFLSRRPTLHNLKYSWANKCKVKPPTGIKWLAEKLWTTNCPGLPWDADLSKACSEKPQWEEHIPGVNWISDTGRVHCMNANIVYSLLAAAMSNCMRFKQPSSLLFQGTSRFILDNLHIKKLSMRFDSAYCFLCLSLKEHNYTGLGAGLSWWNTYKYDCIHHSNSVTPFSH